MSSAETLSKDFKSRLRLTTKTVGEDRIKKAKEDNKDVAILSTFLPDSLAEEKDKIFTCALESDCLLGDPTKMTPGTFLINYINDDYQFYIKATVYNKQRNF